MTWPQGDQNSITLQQYREVGDYILLKAMWGNQVGVSTVNKDLMAIPVQAVYIGFITKLGEKLAKHF